MVTVLTSVMMTVVVMAKVDDGVTVMKVVLVYDMVVMTTE